MGLRDIQVRIQGVLQHEVQIQEVLQQSDYKFFFFFFKNLYHKGQFYLKKMSLSNFFFLHFKEKGEFYN